MNPFAGKSTTERNKIIAALVLGFVSLAALYLAFGQSLFAGSKTVAVTAKATPTPSSSSSSSSSKKMDMPTAEQRELPDATTPIVYNPSAYQGSPEPGRNIFAFYEPPLPCPTCPKPPEPVKTPPTPTPTPTPPMRLEFVTPQTIYAGAGSFRLEANGDKFDPSAKIYFRKSEMPTQFVNDKKLVANIPASMIAMEGQADIIVQTPDGKLYSDQVLISVQPPPKPQFQYVGMIARARHNNDTAYFMEQGKQLPTSARLNDVLSGRFRLVSISSSETIFEDVSLGFKHKIPLFRPPPGTTTSPTNGPGFRGGGFPSDPNVYVPYNPNQQIQPGQEIPGIPNNIPRAQPPQNVQRPQPKKTDKDEDDDGDGGGNP